MSGHLPLAGKRGLVTGIANADSIAWGCAKAFRAMGAELAVTYLNDKALPHVAAGWGLGNGWVVGVGGYVYRQWSDDKVGGVALAGSRGRSQSIGPSVRYANGKGWLITAKVEKEFGVRNRAQGSQFWLKTTIPF